MQTHNWRDYLDPFEDDRVTVIAQQMRALRDEHRKIQARARTRAWRKRKKDRS